MSTPTADQVAALGVVADVAAMRTAETYEAHGLAVDVWSDARDAYVAARKAFRESTT